MNVYHANKEKFREDILSNRIEEIVHESFQGALGGRRSERKAPCKGRDGSPSRLPKDNGRAGLD
jgi:hypothetical protein